MTITRFGSAKLSRALNKWEENIVKEAKRIVVGTAAIIQSEANSRVPSDTGYLKKSIEKDISHGGLEAKVTVDANYAIYVEYGTGIYAVDGNGRKTSWVFYSEKYNQFFRTQGMHAQPFWFPAIEVGRTYFEKEMKKLGR